MPIYGTNILPEDQEVNYKLGRPRISELSGDIQASSTAVFTGSSNGYFVRILSPELASITDTYAADGDDGFGYLNNISFIQFADGLATLADRIFDGTSASAVSRALSNDGWTMFGMEGNDTIYGRKGSDTLYGEEGNDKIYGSDGDDTLVGGEGADRLNGGNGTDTAIFTGLSNDYGVRYSTSGNVVITDKNLSNGDEGTDTAFDVEFLEFANGVANLADRSFDGTISDDVIRAFTNDIWTLHGREGADDVRGREGNDFFYYRGSDGGFDTLYGGSEFDTVAALEDDTVIGLQSFIRANAGIELITSNGFSGVSIHGNEQANVYDFSSVTLAGISLISSGAGNDNIGGSAGDDVIHGGSGSDQMNGAGGNDTFLMYASEDGFDSLGGAEGFDTILAMEDNTVMKFTALSTYGDSIEAISGNGFSNVSIVCDDLGRSLEFYTIALTDIALISGGAAADTIHGSLAGDTILGAGGDDRINGHEGNDTIIGDTGSDTLTGGLGSDTFVYTALTDRGDVITDFRLSDGDKIELRGLLEGYDPLTSAITDFVRIRDFSTSDSLLDVDVDGSANGVFYRNFAIIINAQGLTDEAALLTSGNLLIT